MSKTILSQFPKENNYRRGFWYYFPVTLFAGLMLIAFLTLAYALASIPDAFEPIPEVHAEPIPKAEPMIVEVTQEVIEPQVHLTDEDIIAAVVMSESGNQDLLGKVAVAMTVLNRADYFGMTVEQVVSAPNQYSYPYTGVITSECYRAVEIAKENRDLFPETMMWFRTGSYHSFGEPYEKIGDHYFSKLTEETK